MSNSKAEKEELKKLEDQAYNELCQLIAEAMQFQDIALLDQRIADWKRKYKKLLDSSSPSSANFKKRIEYLLNQFYSEITQYILKQIKKNEEKRIENQSKALTKLYSIIEKTNDLSLLKEKVKEWESKYPMSGFLDMYKKRIRIYTSEKYLKEHSFDQDKAFYDLYYITKLNRTFDGFKEELKKWEDTYSIHDKFELDDFIKNQTEVKRYTSDEYLISIAHEDNIDTQEFVFPEEDILEAYNENSDSSLEKQASAYSNLVSIARKPNNTNEIFEWVYKNNSIKFNDKYKNLILGAIYFDYSPTYLNTLSVPKINLSSSLSFEEYQNIDEIKKYAVISYFNLLLPPEVRVPNNYFNEHIEKIYRKSRKAQFSDEYIEPSNNAEETILEIETDNGTEKKQLEIDISDGQVFDIHSSIENEFETAEEDKTCDVELLEKNKQPVEDFPQDKSDAEQNALEKIGSPKKSLEEDLDVLEIIPSKESNIVHDNFSENNSPMVDSKEHSEENLDVVEPQTIKQIPIETHSSTQDSFDKIEKETIAIDEPDTHIKDDTFKENDSSTSFKKEQSQNENINLNGDTIVAFSPLFFETINTKVNTHKKQTRIISEINDNVDTYMIGTVTKSIDNIKTRNTSD